MYVRPSAPLSVGGVVDDAIRLYRSSFSRCWSLALVLAIAYAGYQIAFLRSLPDIGAPTRGGLLQLLQWAQTRTPGLGLLYLLVFALTLAVNAALVACQNGVVHADASMTFWRALGRGFRRLPGMFIASLLFAVAIGVGLLLLLIPGLYLWGRLQLWFPALLAEDASPFGALDSSWRLTKGHWWRSASIMTVAVILIAVFSISLGALASLVALLVHANLIDRTVVEQLVSAAANVVIYPMAPALWLAMYYDFKLRREGADLAARVGALTSA